MTAGVTSPATSADVGGLVAPGTGDTDSLSGVTTIALVSANRGCVIGMTSGDVTGDSFAFRRADERRKRDCHPDDAVVANLSPPVMSLGETLR
jgi:hypothetical protein